MGAVRPTKKQRELLSFIDGFIAGHGYGPSYREVMRALNYKSVSTVATHIDNLITKGHLRKRDNSARSLEVLRQDASVAQPEIQPKVNEAQEKWLIQQVGSRFKKAESGGVSTGDVDQLYVLVGALHILGFEDAARSFRPRLVALGKKST
jgi:hypothetical protein